MATFSIPPPTLPIGLRLHSVTAADHPRLAAFLSVCHPEQPVTAEDLDRLAQGRMPGEVHAATLLLRGDALVGLAETGTPRMDGHPGWLE